jgi:acyl-CoA thioesterase
MREMLTLRRGPAPGAWRPSVVAVRAREAGGIEALLEAIEAHRAAEGPGRRLRAAPAGTDGVAGHPGHATHGARSTRRSEARDPPRQNAVPDRAVTPPANDAGAWRERLARMAATDGLCAALGITVEAGGPGTATVAMTVGPQHLNFNGGCHGGSIFALADSAFGLASNSHGPVASGIDAHLTFQAGVRLGDRLRAHAVEVRRARQIAFYRVEVVKLGEPSETPVSTFTGTVYVRA